MITPSLKTLLTSQREFFLQGRTRSFHFRIKQLQKLLTLIKTHETAIATALNKDLRKAHVEAVFNEVILVINEIKFAIKHLKKWMTPKNVWTPLPFWPGTSKIYSEPYGNVLILGPWNYPFQLIISPLIGAIAAGNCVILKPSEISSHTQHLLVQLINEHFSSDFLHVIPGGPTVVTDLLNEKWDYIFFTGGKKTGKLIAESAAKHLTPYTLELGGKSPCIVDESADLAFAARRIIWGKFTNAGQTCVAPDYLLVHANCKDELISQLKNVIKDFYGENAQSSKDYGRIINKLHLERLKNLLHDGQILMGGQIDEEDLYLSPTLIHQIDWQDAIMQEEIFGPILPILSYESIDEVITQLKTQPKPLALYCFTNNKIHEHKIIECLSFGGGCINDCVVHIANKNLPFGGVGASGMGQYHGKFSFQTFSHTKSIYKKLSNFDVKLEYPPYSPKKLWWIRKLLK